MTVSTVLSAMQQAVAAQDMSDKDGVNLLIRMSDNAVRQKVGEAFIAQMQNSSRVKSVFFPNPSALTAPLPPTLNDWTGQVASALAALALAQCSGHGFGATVKSGEAQNFLNNNLDPANNNFTTLAMSNYRALFPAYCTADHVNFATFLSGTYGEATRWGTLLADHLSSPSYINQEMIKLNAAVQPDGWYQVFFANVYKLQCLNSVEVQRMLRAWEPQLKGKEQPCKVLQWTVYEHMLTGKYSSQTFMGQVQKAISAIKVQPPVLPAIGGLCSPPVITYGDEVNQWLRNNKELGGFVVGPTNHNVEVGGGCCFAPGTSILLGDGSSKRIEEVQDGDEVLSGHGRIRRRSEQDVYWRMAPHDYLYGVNDHPPFFTASHPFMTTEGWKAISPQATRRINPDLPVKRLQEGDVLLQVDQTEPFRYREVRVDRITKMPALEAPCMDIHSLHLEQENPGYHANGFLVAMNYPQLREEHFVRAFAGVSEAERVYLRRHFEPLIPFLRRGLGHYVNEIFFRALGDPAVDNDANSHKSGSANE